VTPAARLAAYAEKTERLVVGLMSGTSVDAIDAALVRISGSERETRAELVRFDETPWPAELRSRLLQISHGEGCTEDVSELHFELAEHFARAARAVCGTTTPDAVASHGQTVSHIGGVATLQLGSPAVLAARLQTLVVSDFRSADIALGGQGAPLVPFADWCLLTHPTRARAIQNIGGIGNVTYLPPDARAEQVIGFDTGPGNMLLDRAMAHVTQGEKNFDEHGALAASGQPDLALLDWLLTHPFLSLSPPKSAGREEFGAALWERLVEQGLPEPPALLATLTEFTAHSIADAYERFLPTPPEEVIVGGGGARNPFLMSRVAARLPEASVKTHEAVGLDGDAKEAVAFALLANETLLGRPSNLPSVTGASRAVVLGSVTFPVSV
jgi:anhydro-N-acetylmuramic acid kinase